MQHTEVIVYLEYWVEGNTASQHVNVEEDNETEFGVHEYAAVP